MTYEAQTTLLLWIFAGVAVLGIYLLVVLPLLYVWHKLTDYPCPLPDAATDKLIQELNGESRWRKQ